jgi:hypothetical protein
MNTVEMPQNPCSSSHWQSKLLSPVHQTTDMGTQSDTSSVVSRDAVHRTLRRIGAEALSLLARRSEINRRIQDLHQLLDRLGESSTDSSTKTVRSMSAWVGARWRSGGQTSGGQTINSALCDKGPQPGCTMLPRPPRPSSLAKHELARLRRACRIALLEAGGGASLDEIRILIVRRGSFAFMESGPSDSVILQTLIRMRARGEVRCLENDPQKVWERITPPEEVDLFS